jgi:hypothetical protein
MNIGFTNQSFPFPLQVPRLEAHLYWHESVENDPANRWLREEIENVLRPELRAPAEPTELHRRPKRHQKKKAALRIATKLNSRSKML